MQSRVMSLVEVATSSLIGFVVSIWANYAILPLFGFKVRLSESLTITSIFLVISIIRSYLVRRFFATYVKRFAAWCEQIYEDFKSTAFKLRCRPHFSSLPASNRDSLSQRSADKAAPFSPETPRAFP